MTTALADPPAIDTALADLVLLRMSLPGKRPARPGVVRRDVAKLLDSELSASEFDELRNELAAAGLLAKGRGTSFTLTDAGRERALRFLGVAELPPETNWSTLIAKYLFPKAAGLTENAATTLTGKDKPAIFILKRKYGLAAGSGSTMNEVLEAVACKYLGFADEATLEGLMCAVLSKLMRSERLSKETLAKQLPLYDTGLTDVSADAVRRKVVRDWLSGASPRPQSSPSDARADEPFDLCTFAATVRALAAKSPPQDRFHDNKVFIAPLWRASQREPNFPRLSLPDFKGRLIEANSHNLLHLSRADLVQAMDPQLVAESETAYLNATFHFVLLEADRL